jgi:polyferredoxin
MKTHPIERRASSNGQTLRFGVQVAFIILCVWIGVQFVLWMKYHQGISALAVQRPPGVEGFLPISSLMSLWYWMQTGEINAVHPAGLFILVAIVVVSVVFKKSFCSWFCPVGTISESIGEFGKKLLGRNITPWKWLDYPLRSLKYLMLGFFAWVIFVVMRPGDLLAFLESPYNRVADVKMYLFFADISRTALVVLAVLTGLSMVVKNFWCRYLCPYGALLGITGLLSPFRVTRNTTTCIDCAKCAKVCPAAIAVDKVQRVMSDECTSCMACVDACPVARTLEYKVSRRARFSLSPKGLAVAILAVFMVITGLAMVSGHWVSSIGEDEYARRINDIHNPLYQHHYGSAPSESDASLPVRAERSAP